MTQPPANRHAIQTYVTEYDDTIVKDAILHEKARGGQTYFIYNRIESIRAVSYTHLDVYKRQVQSIQGSGGNRICPRVYREDVRHY